MKRLADPDRDLHVIDSRAPRFHPGDDRDASLAVATGWWWLLAALALQLAVGLTVGRRSSGLGESSSVPDGRLSTAQPGRPR